MTTPDTSIRSVVVEREFPQPPEKVWRALSESSFIEQWLMKNDFEPVTDRPFQLRMDPVQGWNGVIDCRVVTVEPRRTLAYTWATMGMESMVTFTLTPTAGGTHVRVEQSGFGPGQDAAYKGAQYGWKSFFGRLEQVVADIA